MKDKSLLYFAVGILTAVGIGAVSIGDNGIVFPDQSLQSRAALGPWSQQLDSTDGQQDGCNSSRFKCVLNDEAVLDMETGLVWERTPATELNTWVPALDLCLRSETGGRKGWRSPTISEAQSLVDPDRLAPALPPDHPFLDVTLTDYWTSTTDYVASSSAFRLNVSSGGAGFSAKSSALGSWCVRGGSLPSFTSQPNS